MSNKSFLENIDDETLAKMIDTTLNFEKSQKSEKVRVNIYKIIPVAAVFLLIIGLINIMPVFLNTNNVDDNINIAGTNPVNISTTVAESGDLNKTTEPMALFVPPIVEKTFFEEKILANITSERDHAKMLAYYLLIDPSNPDWIDNSPNPANSAREEMIKERIEMYPICETLPVYILDPNASERELLYLLSALKAYTPLLGNDLIQMYIDNGIPYEDLPMFTGESTEENLENSDEISTSESSGHSPEGPSGVFEAPNYGVNTAEDGTEYIEFKNQSLYAALMEYFELDRWYGSYITPDMLNQIYSIEVKVKPEYNYLYDNIGLREEFDLNCQYIEYTINGKTLDILPEKFMEGGIIEGIFEDNISEYFDYDAGYFEEEYYKSGYYITKSDLSDECKRTIYYALAQNAAIRMPVYLNEDGSYFTDYINGSWSMYLLGFPARYYDKDEYNADDIVHMPNLREFNVEGISTARSDN